MPVDALAALWAALPILLILGLMTGRRWGAAPAGAAGYLAALLIAVLRFGAGIELLAYAHARGFLLALEVLLIVWGAYVHFRVVDEAGAIKDMGTALPHLFPERGYQALLVGWIFASFLQSVGGFGVPMAVTAPLLLGLGFSPLTSALIPSLGHSWAVTFGSLGAAFQALLTASGVPAAQLTAPAAWLLGVGAVMCGLMVLWAAGGAAMLRRLWLPTLLLALAMAAGQYAGAVLGGVWNLGALAGSVVGLGLAFAASLIARRRRSPTAALAGAAAGAPLHIGRLGLALSGYGVLMVVVLAFQFLPDLRAALGGIRLALDIPPLRTGLGFVTPGGSGRELVLLRHIGFQLLYAAGITYLIFARAQRYTPGAPRRILRATLSGVVSPSVSIVSMISLAQVMESSGMTYTLASTLAGGLGALFPLAAPLIGALGAFMTGSNTNSNVIFAALQAETAHLLGLSLPVILAAQTVGGGLGSALAPAKLVVGAGTVGLNGQEGRLLRRLLPYVLIQLLVIGLLVQLAARW